MICRKFMANVTEMEIPMATPLKYFWMLCWAIIAPAICLVCFNTNTVIYHQSNTTTTTTVHLYYRCCQ